MASATPAAPSPSATPAAGTGAAAPDAAPVAQPVAPTASPIRPIPSPPTASRLPGVYDDDFPAAPSATSSDGSTPADPATPSRGPDGRFVSPSSDPNVAVHTPEPAPAAKFKFADEEYESQQAAEHNFKTLRGHFKPVQGLAKQLGGIDRIVPTLSSAAESARGWKAAHDNLKAELEAIRNGAQPSQPSQPHQPQPPDADTASADVDWELYAEIKKLATEKGEPWKAEQWLITEVRKAERSHVEKLLEQRDAPLKAAQAKQALAAQTETLFGNLADYTNADGSPAFPELADEAAAYEVGKLWASLGLPPQAALTPQGAIAAIALYRESKRSAGSQAGPAPTSTPMQPPPAMPPTATDTAAAAGMTDGRPSAASVPGMTRSDSPEAAAILAGLRQANKNSRSNVLGFDA